MSKVIIGIIAIVVLMIMFPLVMSSTHDIQTDQQTDADLALGGTPPAGTCTLTTALWQDDINSVLSAIGDKETLTVVSYTPATKLLTLTDVVDSTKVTVVYEIDALTEFTGMGALVGLTPLLIWIAILASILGGLFLTFRGKFGGE